MSQHQPSTTVRSPTKKHPGLDQGTLGFFVFFKFCGFFWICSRVHGQGTLGFLPDLLHCFICFSNLKCFGFQFWLIWLLHIFLYRMVSELCSVAAQEPDLWFFRIWSVSDSNSGWYGYFIVFCIEWCRNYVCSCSGARLMIFSNLHCFGLQFWLIWLLHMVLYRMVLELCL